MEIVRSQLSVLQKRLAEPRRCIQVLAGPRQVGKTTLIKQLTKEIDVPVWFVSADGLSVSDFLLMPIDSFLKTL